jgi:hypothetical protein
LTPRLQLALAVALALSGTFALGCGTAPASAPLGSAAPPQAPAVDPCQAEAVRLPNPVFPERPMRTGEAYTVWGASVALRSRATRATFKDKVVKITGYVTKTNLADAPRCAVHRAVVPDPPNCSAAFPAFWLGDRKDSPEAESIKVMGWASNYAEIHDAIRQFDAGKKEYLDLFWGVPLPNPLPAAGARVTVSGEYAIRFLRAASNAETNETMGILVYSGIVYLEPSSDVATLPGMRRKGR